MPYDPETGQYVTVAPESAPAYTQQPASILDTTRTPQPANTQGQYVQEVSDSPALAPGGTLLNNLPTDLTPEESAAVREARVTAYTGPSVEAGSVELPSEVVTAPTPERGDAYVTPEMLVQNQLASILQQGSPLFQVAEDRARQQAQQMGLLSSSMAVGAGQYAMTQQALPIAQQDAQTYGQFGLAGQQAEYGILQRGYEGDIAATLQAQKTREQMNLTAQQGQVQMELQQEQGARQERMQQQELASQEKITDWQLTSQEAIRMKELDFEGWHATYKATEDYRRLVEELASREQISILDAANLFDIEAMKVAQAVNIENAKINAEVAMRTMEINATAGVDARNKYLEAVTSLSQNYNSAQSQIISQPTSQLSEENKTIRLKNLEDAYNLQLSRLAMIYGQDTTWTGGDGAGGYQTPPPYPTAAPADGHVWFYDMASNSYIQIPDTTQTPGGDGGGGGGDTTTPPGGDTTTPPGGTTIGSQDSSGNYWNGSTYVNVQQWAVDPNNPNRYDYPILNPNDTTSPWVINTDGTPIPNPYLVSGGGDTTGGGGPDSEAPPPSDATATDNPYMWISGDGLPLYLDPDTNQWVPVPRGSTIDPDTGLPVTTGGMDSWSGDYFYAPAGFNPSIANPSWASVEPLLADTNSSFYNLTDAADRANMTASMSDLYDTWRNSTTNGYNGMTRDEMMQYQNDLYWAFNDPNNPLAPMDVVDAYNNRVANYETWYNGLDLQSTPWMNQDQLDAQGRPTGGYGGTTFTYVDPGQWQAASYLTDPNQRLDTLVGSSDAFTGIHPQFDQIYADWKALYGDDPAAAQHIIGRMGGGSGNPYNVVDAMMKAVATGDPSAGTTFYSVSDSLWNAIDPMTGQFTGSIPWYKPYTTPGFVSSGFSSPENYATVTTINTTTGLPVYYDTANYNYSWMTNAYKQQNYVLAAQELYKSSWTPTNVQTSNSPIKNDANAEILNDFWTSTIKPSGDQQLAKQVIDIAFVEGEQALMDFIANY